MARALWIALIFSGLLAAQKQEPPYPDPPEEDESLAPRTYVFNPLQAKKEIDAGNFYWKKGNYRAAANRYHEATLWDDSSTDAFYKLGESYEKLHEYEMAREAFAKYIELIGDQKKAADVRKRIAKFPAPGK